MTKVQQDDCLIPFNDNAHKNSHFLRTELQKQQISDRYLKNFLHSILNILACQEGMYPQNIKTALCWKCQHCEYSANLYCLLQK